MGFLVRAACTAVAIAVAAFIVPGIHWGLVDYGLGEPGKYLSLLVAAIALGLVNGIVRPILVIVSLPLTCATLGLFIFVINALLLLLVSAIPPAGLSVDGLWSALVGSIIISIVSAAISKVVR